MRKLAESRRYRRESGEFFCDGEKLLGEAVSSGVEITCVMTCEDLKESTTVNIMRVSRDIIEYISPMKTPQPVVFSCKTPTRAPEREGKGVVVFETLQDPGNLGAVIRSADAFGIEKVILLDGSADLYSPKTIRAAMGAVFRQPVLLMNHSQLSAWLEDERIPLLGAALTDRAESICDIDLSGAAVAVGSEGGGLTPELLNMCSREITIPMYPGSESLNAAVAASIIMWEIYKR